MRRLARWGAFLLCAVALLVAVTWAVGRFSGHRVYLLNSTNCRIWVMTQHDGHVVKSGETALVKSGFVERTPTVLIGSGDQTWFGGLHFTESKLQIRGQDDISIPVSWRASSLFGSTLTYELTGVGQLVIQPPQQAQLLPTQPAGLPMQARSGIQLSKCIRS